MRKIRVLVVDDSLVVRRVVMEELGTHDDLEVVGSANNGRVALERIAQLDPDLVILDIEMPEMDGLAVLPPLRERWPKLPVIMFSSLTELGAAATLEALARGASDFFAKPSCAGGLDASRQVIRTELVPAIRALAAPRIAAACSSNAARRSTSADSAARRASHAGVACGTSESGHGIAAGAVGGSAGGATHSSSATSAPNARVDVLAIGASTGGPNALAQIFTALPANFPVPIVVVQHMPPMFTQMLAERLTKISPIATAEARQGTILEPGKAWIAPGDFHLTVARDGGRVRLLVNQDPPENACRPAVDPLFRSVANVYGRHSLAVILTGMGQDGWKGCERIRAVDGRVLAQDEASSVVWGMPGAVARAGLADRVLPLPQLAGEILRRAGFGRD